MYAMGIWVHPRREDHSEKGNSHHSSILTEESTSVVHGSQRVGYSWAPLASKGPSNCFCLIGLSWDPRIWVLKCSRVNADAHKLEHIGLVSFNISKWVCIIKSWRSWSEGGFWFYYLQIAQDERRPYRKLELRHFSDSGLKRFSIKYILIFMMKTEA